MDSRQVRGMMEAAQSELRGVNTGFRALAGPAEVSELCASWLLLREALKDIEGVCQEKDMGGGDKARYALGVARTALDSVKASA
jgi:hypothetical protein